MRAGAVRVHAIVGSRSIANGEVEIEDHETLTVEAAINKLIAAK
ncbi:hypothetical protein M2267_002945 [Ensifer sp. KUDG1]